MRYWHFCVFLLFLGAGLDHSSTLEISIEQDSFFIEFDERLEEINSYFDYSFMISEDAGNGCEVTGQYEEPDVVETQTARGWMYEVSHSMTGTPCRVRVQSGQDNFVLFLDSYNGICELSDADNHKSMDCIGMSETEFFEKVVVEDNSPRFHVFLKQDLPDESFVRVAMPVGSIFGASRSDQREKLEEGSLIVPMLGLPTLCEFDQLLVSVINGQEVVSSELVAVECTQEVISCGDFVCAESEKGFCSADCVDPLRLSARITHNDGPMRIDVLTLTYVDLGDSCIASSPGLIEETSFESKYAQLGEPMGATQYARILDGAEAREYEVTYTCGEFTSVDTVSYCDGCGTPDLCIPENTRVDGHYCYNQIARPVLPTGAVCAENIMCDSGICSENICQNKPWWHVFIFWR